jgi:hypothetical protein
MAITVDKSELEKQFNKLIKNAKSNDPLKRLGFYVIKTIQTRTRKKGQGVARPGGNRRKLKPVSLEWAIRRATLQRHPEAATGSRSNLTFKGTMLDSMQIKQASRGQLFIGFKNAKEEAKAEGNEDRGRPFMYLGKVEIQSAIKFYKEEILKDV